MSLQKGRIFLVTKNKHNGCQRKIAWFSKHKNDLYFEVFGFIKGSHISYHKDGSIWRTSPAVKKNKIGQYLPLDQFKGGYQLGTSMIEKKLLNENPCLKKRERNRAYLVEEVDMDEFPSDILNILVEFIDPSVLDTISEKFKTPKYAKTLIISSLEPYIVLTILGHDQNLLIRPQKDGFIVHHYNDRYSLNRKDVQYRYEAYGETHTNEIP